MALGAASDRARLQRSQLPGIHEGVTTSEKLLLTSAAKRLSEHGAAAVAGTPDAPPRMAVFYVATFKSLRLLGTASGARNETAAAARAVLAMTRTQDRIYAGGLDGLVASRQAPGGHRRRRTPRSPHSRDASPTAPASHPAGRPRAPC